MKKVVLLLVLILFAGVNFSYAKEKSRIKPLPIPSFNVLIDERSAFLEEGSGGNFREKRDLHVVVSTTSHGMSSGDARVWVVKGDYEVVLGPFYVAFEEELSVPIDGDQWGAVIQAQEDVYVDIWINGQ
jgi:hypothetical protein